MRTALTNGKIYCARDHFAQALLIEDGIIRQVGTDAEILAQGNISEHIDCEGKTVIPGLNDSHLHLMLVGEALQQFSLAQCHSVAEMIAASRAYAAEHPEVRQRGLYGRAWNQDYFTGERRIPTRHDLDQISTEYPIVLERVCGHILVTNTRAIQLLGLGIGSPQYEGGTFELEADGFPNGVFTENACTPALALITATTLAEKRELLLSAMRYAVSRGITTVQSNDLSFAIKDRAGFIQMLRSIFTENDALLRYRLQACFATPEDFAEACESGLYHQAEALNTELFTIGPLKLFKDGSLGARTAMMRQPYADDPGNTGVVALDRTTMDRYCAIARDYGIPVATHVIGDRAIEEVVDAYEAVQSAERNVRRNSLIHCQITSQQDLERIARLGILVQYQPIFLNYDLHIAVDRVGEAMASTSYAFNTMAELGGHVSYGTDAPVEDCNPFENMFCAITRQDLTGYPAGGFFPSERVDVAAAVDAYTEGSAYCEFLEGRKGRLAAGQMADMVILDHDIFTCTAEELRDTLPIRTIVGGRTVYQR